MKIALCDDEKQQRAILKQMIRQSSSYDDSFELHEYASGKELITAIYKEELRFDIIFLDIVMDGANGIETARAIRKNKHNPIIIFVTGLMDYALQAFEVKAFRYLLKPVSQQKFDKELRQALNEICNVDNKYIIRANQRVVNLNISEIVYMESNLRKISLYSVDDMYTFYGKFAEQAVKLARYGFITINRGILVNLSFIKCIEKADIHLKTGAVLPLSRNRRKEIYDSFTQYQMEKAL